MVKSAAYFKFPQFVAYKKAAREGERERERDDCRSQRGERVIELCQSLSI